MVTSHVQSSHSKSLRYHVLVACIYDIVGKIPPKQGMCVGGVPGLVVFADDVFTAPWNWHVFTTHVLGTYFTHAQTCNVTRVQSTTEWTASVHTLHMPKHVM